ASVPAGQFQFGFCSYLLLHIFNLALVPGRTNFESLPSPMQIVSSNPKIHPQHKQKPQNPKQ
ncbi:MAG: hypothetical protein ABIM99_00255, partial [Candidatus Dojkabacteria bacterium]